MSDNFPHLHALPSRACAQYSLQRTACSSVTGKYAQGLCLCCVLLHVRLCVSLQTLQRVLSLRNTLRGFAKLSSYS